MTENKNKSFEYYIKKLLEKFEKEKDLASCYLLYTLAYCYEQSIRKGVFRSQESVSLLAKKFLSNLEKTSVTLNDLYVQAIDIQSTNIDTAFLVKNINTESELECEVLKMIEIYEFVFLNKNRLAKKMFSQLSLTDSNLKLCAKLFELCLSSKVNIANLDNTSTSVEYLAYYGNRESFSSTKTYKILLKLCILLNLYILIRR